MNPMIIKALFKRKRTTPRQTYIKMLSERSVSIDSLTPEQRGNFLWSELISGGYLNGVTHENASGVPVANVLMGPTVKGRLFLQELETEEFKESNVGKLKHWLTLLIGFIGGVMTVILTEFLKKMLHL